MATILVVDDESAIRNLVCSMVAAAGHRHLSSANGLEALILFRAEASAIDLVITDMRMPVMGGAESVARMREIKPDLPVICMTGYQDESLPPNAYFIEKPFSLQQFRALVDRALHR